MLPAQEVQSYHKTSEAGMFSVFHVKRHATQHTECVSYRLPSCMYLKHLSQTHNIGSSVERLSSEF